uniref:Malic enzyme n=2 Tax=Neobodo designis TaxID=312471 RepID=A0A7S1W7V0_NEODS|mmetsp:Transcript_6358/g.20015  ORF Transcript_6358/g.20015 Transcript_6358/m.20015 type:complete len:581 (+) Transcript_6358:114-1856(+)
MLRRSARRLDISNIKWYPRPLAAPEYGRNIIEDGLWNKAMAFDLVERDRLGLRGLLPPSVRTLDEQVEVCLNHIRSQPNAVAKNIYLQGLHNRNETLFHRVLLDHIEEVAPLVYTPTVGVACQKFGYAFRQPRGMFFSTQDRGYMSTMVHNWPRDDVHVIVVTDGSRILGLGDLGANGMGIPIGKLALYCALGGIAPHRVLPVMLDVGTNNQKLLDDPGYIGMRHKRLQGNEYFDMVDEFMTAVVARWPEATIQFEDFETPKAVPLLAKYRNKFRCFNDDMQGTGAVTVGALLSAARIADTPISDLRVVCCGGGSAGQGVSASVIDAMVRAGLTQEEAKRRIVIVTNRGAIGKADGKHGNPHAGSELWDQWHNDTVPDGTPLEDVFAMHEPNCLLGLTGVGGIFTESVITKFGKYAPRPIIMPMSNPTSNAECTAEQAYHWTEGRAIVATGSPFAPVEYKGKTLVPSQCNNMYVFPGIGLAGSVGGTQRFTDQMFYSAAQASTACISDEEIDQGRVFPHVRKIRQVSHDVAVAVLKEGQAQLLNPKINKHHLREGWDALVSRKMYYPQYVPLYSEKPLRN